tara:strand:+ start:17 stop:433 length:417 start_codon:yes stop_codon:yes gene_type:complete
VNKKKNKFLFDVKNINQVFEIINICKKSNILPIILIKFFLINKLGTDWLIQYRNILNNKYNKNDFSFLVNCRNNYGFFIFCVKEKFEYLSVKADRSTLISLKNIAKKNKVTVNPKISIIDVKSIKKIKIKIEKELLKK